MVWEDQDRPELYKKIAEGLQIGPWEFADIPMTQFIGLFCGEPALPGTGHPGVVRARIDDNRERRGQAPMNWAAMDKWNDGRQQRGEQRLGHKEYLKAIGSE